MSSVIITGVDGFVGTHLAAAAKQQGHRVIGITQSQSLPTELSSLLDECLVADLRQEWPEGLTADVIVHLAGLAAIGPSFRRPQAYLSGNSAMVTTMCEHALRLSHSVRPRILGVSSGAVYAVPPDGRRVSEDCVLAYSSPYVVSKCLVENQLSYYRERGLDTLVARPFNHIGPGQSPGFLVPDLYRSLRSASTSAPLLVGNLATERDYTDVRDVADAYLMLATADNRSFDVYNVASGVATSGWRILALLAAELSVPVPKVEVDLDRVRARDPAVVVGDSGRLHTEFGWSPYRTVEESVRDFVRRAKDVEVGVASNRVDGKHGGR